MSSGDRKGALPEVVDSEAEDSTLPVKDRGDPGGADHLLHVSYIIEKHGRGIQAAGIDSKEMARLTHQSRGW